MATKRSHHKLQINTKNIRKAAEQMVIKQELKVQKAGKKAMQEIRTKAVTDWFISLIPGTNAYEAMINATEYEASDIVWKGRRAYIYITSGVNIKKYQEYMLTYHRTYDNANGFSTNGRSSLENWKLKHIKSMNIPKTYGQYMFDLKWNEGIYALPSSARDTGTGWVNKNYISGTPLELYITTRIARNWYSTVNKYLGIKSKKK